MDSATGGVVRSVNVADSRDLTLNGKTHPTGIFKEPVGGRVMLAGNSVAGDLVADPQHHGGPLKAVYCYTVEDYAWWAEELGNPLVPGTFGENLTLEGISATDALIGERWSVGGAVLAVTQPREPCWKLGQKMGDPNFPRRFREAGLSGAYLAILTEGEVGTGDRIEVLSRPPHPVSIGMLAFLEATDREVASLLVALIAQDLSTDEWDEIVRALQLPPKYPWRDDPANG